MFLLKVLLLGNMTIKADIFSYFPLGKKYSDCSKKILCLDKCP